VNKYERLQRKWSIVWYFLVECIALTIQPRRAATVMWSISSTVDDYSKFPSEVPLFLEMLVLPEFSYEELWGTMEGSLHARNQLDRPVILIQYWRYRTIDPDWIQGNSSLVRVVDGWNSLPAKVVNSDSVNSFKNAYDRYYFKDMDNRSWSAACPSTYKYK